LKWTQRYVDEVRPSLLVPGLVAMEDSSKVDGSRGGPLFVSNDGADFTPNTLSMLMGSYVTAAKLPGGKRGACHLFRHTMATLMLENGADVRFIQAILGHADLNTTQIYTHVSIRKLKDIHAATHPAKLERTASPTTI